MHTLSLKHLLTTSALIACVFTTVTANATGTNTVAAGSATTTTVGSTTTITQTTPNVVLDWTAPGAFNTTAGETIQFVQPSATSVALNRITGGPTTFQGTLTANGKVWLINPDGMLFDNASINVGSLLLSNAGISNAEGNGFYTNSTGHYNFDQTGNKQAIIELYATTVKANGDGTGNGDVTIMAPAVVARNYSHIDTTTGVVQILAGETFTADFNGDGLINYQPAGAAIVNAVSQKVAGTDSSIYLGVGTTINTVPFGNPHKALFAVKINEDAVLDNVINFGGAEINGNSGISNPELVSVNNFEWQKTIVPLSSPPVTPPSTPAASTPAPGVFAQNYIINPLTRPLTSVGDETVIDTVVNPSISNVTYARPYLVNLDTSVNRGKLTLLSSTNTAASPTNLGNLSPSAGGDTAEKPKNAVIGCANSYLDAGWKIGSIGVHCTD